MKLHGVTVRTDATSVRLVGDIELGKGAQRTEVYFQFPIAFRDFVAETAAPFVTAMLVPSMLAREPVESAVTVSRELLFGLRRVRDLMRTWYPKLHRTPIEVPEGDDAPPPRRDRAMSFFSGGVDSFYTLLKYRHQESLPSPLTHIVMMRGVETKLHLIAGVEAAERAVMDAADAVGVACIVGETNIRTVLRAHWERYHFGSGLASVAYALSDGFDYACIPSSMSYRYVIPHGSSPVLDELLSTPRMRIVHDGAEASRPQKTARIVEWAPEIVLPRLRVCTQNEGGDTNCGRCYKCVRTAVALTAMGRWSDATSFRDKSTAHWPRAMAEDHHELVEENLEFARERGASPDLIAMLERAVGRHQRREAFLTLVRNSPARRLWQLVPRLRSGRR